MEKQNLDKVILLLGTDWFLPYWFTLGLAVETQKRACVQQGCREIAKQILGSAKEYWLTDFSNERVERTHSMLQMSMQKCRLDEAAKERIAVLIGDAKASTIDDRTSSLTLFITRELFNNALAEPPTLNPAIKTALARAWSDATSSNFKGIDFEKLCLDSASPWDAHTRSLTPDLPTYLADFVKATARQSEFSLLWTLVTPLLSKGQRRELVHWFRTVGQSVTGEPLDLPLDI
jgi:hypothetical protein